MAKRQDIELIRILAAFEIVWFHSKAPGNEIAYSGLVIFIILSMFLGGKSASSTPRRRFERLLIPWLVWFAIYALFNYLTHRTILPMANGPAAAVLIGPEIHLWYLPFIFFCLIVLDFVKRRLSPKAMALGSALFASLAILATVPLWRPESLQMGEPIAQYAHAGAAVFLGVFFMCFDALEKRVAIFLMVANAAVAALMISYEGVGIPYLIGILVGYIIVAGWLQRAIKVNFTVLSECTFGIYLIHVLVLIIILGKFRMIQGILVPLATFFASALVVLIGRRLYPRLAKYWS